MKQTWFSAILLAFALAACVPFGAGDHALEGSPKTTPSVSPTPSPTPSASPSPSPTPSVSPTPSSTPSASPSPSPTPSASPSPSPTPPAAASLIISPRSISTAFRNPGKGWVVYDYTPFSSNQLENTELASMVYSNFFSWGDLEPREGQYDFSGVDNLFSKTYPGQKIGLAIVSIDGTSRPHAGARGYGQVPRWLQARMAPYEGRCLTSTAGLAVEHDALDPYGCVLSPYYWHPYYLAAHRKLIQALADRYAAPKPGQLDWRNRIELIEISTFGYWGEWHDSEQPWPDIATQKATTKQMVDDYFDAFRPHPEIRLEISGVVSRVTPASAEGPSQDLTNIYYALGKGAGVTRKFLGGYEGAYLSYLESLLLQSYVPYTPVRLEWGSFKGNIFDFVDSRYPTYRGYLSQAIDRGLQFQASYLGWHRIYDEIYCRAGEINYDNCSTREDSTLEKKVFDSLSMRASNGETLREYAQKRMGYRFELTRAEYRNRARPQSEFVIQTTWNQVGVAKLYGQYFLKFWFAASDGKEYVIGQTPFTANTWPLGVQTGRNILVEGLSIPSTAAPGMGKMKFAVVDRTGNPAMNLAIAGKEIAEIQTYARYDLGPLFLEAQNTSTTTTMARSARSQVTRFLNFVSSALGLSQ